MSLRSATVSAGGSPLLPIAVQVHVDALAKLARWLDFQIVRRLNTGLDVTIERAERAAVLFAIDEIRHNRFNA